VDLNSLIPADSHWTLFDARAITTGGQIVGVGLNPDGAFRAYLLTPVEVPEPRSLFLLALGALGLGGPAWRRRQPEAA
jgi:hypothetical protein